MALAGATAVILAAAAPAAAAKQAEPTDRRTPRGFFGVTPQAPLGAADFDAMAAAGVGTLRIEISWAAADAAAPAGDYDWSLADATIGSAAERGIRVLPFLYSTPPWVARADGHACADPACPPFAPTGPEALAAWSGFAAALEARYGPGGEFWTESGADNPALAPRPIRTWQIWNEQNSPSFYRPRPDVRTYARLLDRARNAIVAGDPGARIVLGGMFGTPRGARRPALAAWTYLRKLYAVRGARRDFDGVAPHPYAGKMGKVKAQLDRFRREIEAVGDRQAGLWVTELGWASGGPPSPLNRGRAGQAKSLRRAFSYLRSKRRELKIENVDWYSWRDVPATGPSICEWCPKSGLVTETLEAKPALRAFARFTRVN